MKSPPARGRGLKQTNERKGKTVNVLADLLASKKFLTLLVTAAGAIVSACTGAVAWPDALKAVLVAVGVYIAAQGVADGLSGGMTSSQPGTPSAADLPK